MKILAIDTATKFLSLGIYSDGALYEYNLEVGPKLSSLLTVSIKRALEALGLGINDLDYFACGLGPGSFTGMRVGLSAMKGLSWLTHKPLIGVSTLDTLAMNAGADARMVIPVIDAKRSLIYSCFYRNTGSVLKKLSPYLLVSKEELLKKIKSPALLFGDALGLYREDILKNTAGLVLLDKDRWYPKAHNIIKLALARIKNKKFDILSEVNPIYLYPKECQIKKSQKSKLRK
ncbi:MAG: tRNA (adenosine(37)-N6)-threonylcarbamoyltransferase complex dimerization subunit type 1 TsaB [Candidatus Omnitrophica bacterium]|nr:tRNA (adenosine(37)-N6)-threonylcarbamoyltransferase complex dimerization subunit type 1 TsaB [Candidatus Omnitrophota bacterium]MDD5027479.1 tRNA (adenosine(37)-N6)-threonylcarbamoyltransferase complex dimerization subunit type 1 TsaB [Candidatus Omnitrophota bacterium]MDD5662407.1 tRNA (adenosine(37)-N6)-threonylcarbamoyltransferase complex dimerization subunit type 1 TsaB [Candidatus Omnitrophota bacterium]